MARWEGGARRRLVRAAFGLFAEQGYDGTTVAQIAVRAGVTTSTLFRHFACKRDLLAAGEEQILDEVVDLIAQSPTTDGPAAALAHALDRALVSMATAPNDAPGLVDVLTTDDMLRSRDPVRSVGLAAGIAAALAERGADPVVGVLLGEIGVAALRAGLAEAGRSRSTSPATVSVRAATLAALDDMLATCATLRPVGDAARPGAAPRTLT